MPAVESTRKRGDSADRTSLVEGGRDFRYYESQKFSYRAQRWRHFLNTGRRASSKAGSSSRHCPRSAGRPIAKRGRGQVSRGRGRLHLRKAGELNPCRVTEGLQGPSEVFGKQASGLQKLFAASGDAAVRASDRAAEGRGAGHLRYWVAPQQHMLSPGSVGSYLFE